MLPANVYLHNRFLALLFLRSFNSSVTFIFHNYCCHQQHSDECMIPSPYNKKFKLITKEENWLMLAKILFNTFSDGKSGKSTYII